MFGHIYLLGGIVLPISLTVKEDSCWLHPATLLSESIQDIVSCRHHYSTRAGMVAERRQYQCNHSKTVTIQSALPD